MDSGSASFAPIMSEVATTKSLTIEPHRQCPHISGKQVIVGHTPQVRGEVLDMGFLVCIDTDCSRGGWLTALDAGTGRVVQANQRGEMQSRRLGQMRYNEPRSSSTSG